MTVTVTYAVESAAVVDSSNDYNGTVADIVSDGNGGYLNIGNFSGTTEGQFLDIDAQQTGGFSGFTGDNGAVSRLADGNFVVVAENAGSYFCGIYDGSGAELIPPFDLNFGDTSNVDVAGLAGGGFVVVSEFGSGQNNLFVDFFNAVGANTGFVALNDTQNFDDRHASIAALDNGNFVVVWEREIIVTGSTEIIFQIFDPAGAVIVGETVLDQSGTSNTRPSVTATDTGFAVAYEDNGVIGVATVDSAGVVEGNFTHGSGAESNPYITRLNSGVLAIGYEDDFFSDTDVLSILLDTATGNFSGSVSNLIGNGNVIDDQEDIAIAGNGDMFGAVWSNLTDGTTDGEIFQVERHIDGDGDNDVMSADAGFHNVFSGGGGDDIINGSSGGDEINGGDDNDVINGGAAGDLILGGDGNDIINGGAATDSLFGEGGDDLIIIGSGDGLDGADGGSGVDTLDYSGTAGEIIYNLGLDSFTYNDNNVQASGFENFNSGAGNDTIFGSDGDNVLHGGDGNDVIDGGNIGVDALFGGDGDDLLSDNSVNSGTFNGGNGTDTADYSNFIAPGAQYWSIGAGFHGAGGFSAPVGVSFVGIENLIALGEADNFVRGSGVANVITGQEGNDNLRGFGGADTLVGGAGNDYLEGGAGEIDTMLGGLGNDIYVVLDTLDSVDETGGDGIDEVRTTVNFTLGDGFENLRLQGSAVSGTGNALDNLIIGGAAANTLDGAGGNDTVTGNSNNDSLLGGDGDDFLFGGQGNDNANGGIGDDTLRGDDGSDVLIGGDGNDLVQGGIGIDSLSGGDGNDILRGEAQNDNLTGGAGADTLQGGDGNDSITGGLDRDVMTGGAGTDNFFWDDGDFAGLTNALADRVTDFVQGSDRLRLNLVDAIAGGGDNAFTFIGTGAFTSVAGQLRYSQAGGVTLITGDTDGNGVADVAIALTGVINLVAGDFVL